MSASEGVRARLGSFDGATFSVDFGARTGIIGWLIDSVPEGVVLSRYGWPRAGVIGEETLLISGGVPCGLDAGSVAAPGIRGTSVGELTGAGQMFW